MSSEKLIKKMGNAAIKHLTIRKIMLLLFILYIIPAFINYDFNVDNRFSGAKISLPYLYAGDQIHYYVLLYSLLKDGDFDIRNNYYNSEHNLTYDVGYLFRGQHLFRYGGYFNFKTKDYKPLWLENPSPPPLFIEAKDPGKEYGMILDRELGLPLFYYVLLLPFNFLKNPEPLVIFISIFLVLAGLYIFYHIFRHFLKDEKISCLFTLFLGVSTEIWLYSKLFYPDELQFFLLSLIIYLFIIRKSNLFAGILFAISIFIRPIFAIMLPVFLAYRFFYLERYSSFSEVRWNVFRSLNFGWFKRLVFLASPSILVTGILFYINYYFYGGILTNPNFSSLPIRNIFDGLFVTFFKLDRGLFVFSPVLIFSIFGLRSFYRRHKIDSMFIYAILLCNMLFLSSTLIHSKGLDTYALRYYVQLIPLFFIPLAFWYKDTIKKKSEGRNKLWLALFYVALAISILINFQAAIFNPLSWNGPPWKMLVLFIENFGSVKLAFL